LGTGDESDEAQDTEDTEQDTEQDDDVAAGARSRKKRKYTPARQAACATASPIDHEPKREA